MVWRLLVALILVLTPLPVSAAVVGVTAKVSEEAPPTPADTVIVFRGIAYPASTVTIERGGNVLVRVPADPAARFDVSLTQQPVGTSTYTIFATDAQDRVGNEMNFTVTLTQGSTVTLSGIFLGPTIEADKTQLKLGETITFLGATAPESTVTVIIESGEQKTFTTTADASGLWTRQILATDLGVGDHSAKAKATAPTQEISDFSDAVAFSVTSVPDACDGKKRGDINCDGKVNLTDFSIMLFYWQQRNPKNARADINRDGIVNLTDFSILLFNWSR